MPRPSDRTAPVSTTAGVVLVTGCGSPSGLGWATTRTLAARGFRVIATVRRAEQLEQLAELRAGLSAAAAGRVELRRMDLLEPETVDRVLIEVENGAGLDVLVNNAGYGLIGGIEQTTLEQARANLETNFLATMGLVQRALPRMRERRVGHIVNVSSAFVPGLCPPGIGWYIASKAALEAAAQALAVEVAPFGIRITNFQPGPISTELSRDWGSRLAPESDPRPGLLDQLYAWVASFGVQTPAEAAEALADLLRVTRPPLARPGDGASERYVAAALQDPGRDHELDSMLTAFGEL